MPARAIWRAELRLGAIRVPVKLYAAVQDAAIHFRLLHAADHAPVTQEMVDPVHDRPVAREQVQKGLEVDEGTFVVLQPAELAALAPPPSREVAVEQFVAPAAIDLRWFERPYFLGPDGDDAAYAALVQELRRRDRVGIARWVMRRKRHQGALYARGDHLVLQRLRHAEELVAIEAVRPPAGRAPDAKERALAEQLVAALEGTFDPAAYQDEHRELVRRLVEAKRAGRPAEPPPAAPAERAAEPLRAALEASLREVAEAARGS